MARRTTRGASWIAVTVTCLVATASYAGAVTQDALVGGVLPGVLMSAVVVAVLSHRHGLALVAGLSTAFSWAVVVNAVTGDSNGPAARSTLIAGACTAVAVAGSRTRWPGLFLAAVCGIVVGAVALGAGGEVRIVATGVVVAAVVTLALLESERRQWIGVGLRPVSVAVVALLVGVASISGALVHSRLDDRPARVLDPNTVNTAIHPRWNDPLPNPAPTTSRDLRGQAAAPSEVRSDRREASETSWLWFAYLALVLLALLAGLAAVALVRQVVVRLRWRRVRRRLQAGAPQQAIAGAWVWARQRLAACRLPLTPSAAPDLDDSMGLLADLPESVAAPLRALAPQVAVCAFSAAPLADSEAAVRAWSLADEAADAGWTVLTTWGRWRARYRSPIELAQTGKAIRMTREASRG